MKRLRCILIVLLLFALAFAAVRIGTSTYENAVRAADRTEPIIQRTASPAMILQEQIYSSSS